MKPAEARIARAIDGADPAIRLFLFHGPDEAAAQDYARRLGMALGEGAERIDLTAAQLKSDPARLADEAAAISLFGGARWIRLDPATDDATEAASALLDASAAGNPTVAIGPALRKDSRLVKLAAASPLALVHACYVPEGRDADALAIELGRDAGLDMRADVARRLVQGANGDRAILAQEMAKIALYLDAAPDRRRVVDVEVLEAIGAASEDGDLTRLVGAVFAGEAAVAEAELGRLASEGVEGVPVLRALGRRLLLLAQLRALTAGGESIDRVMQTAGKAVFWKEQDSVRRALARWTPEALATAAARIGAGERKLKASGSLGLVGADEEILAIVRHAARHR